MITLKENQSDQKDEHLAKVEVLDIDSIANVDVQAQHHGPYLESQAFDVMNNLIVKDKLCPLVNVVEILMTNPKAVKEAPANLLNCP